MILRPPPTVYAALCAVSLGLFSGCASDSDAVEKRLSQLRDDIRKLQNDNDRVSERLEAVELRQARTAASQNAPKAAASAETVSRPRLKVLHLTPGDENPTATGAGSEPTNPESGPRMILKGQGKELELKQGAGDSSSRAAPREKNVALSQNEGASPGNGAD
ncbi:MAG TPA: hypothetical protein VM686_32715 [Polyangiaceae bacterium]|nr:hypothetical protein [Polyangiaceae bacterium]